MPYFIYKSLDGTDIVQAQINTYKTYKSIWSSVTLVPANPQTSATIDVRLARQMSLNCKIVNGGTGPTIAAMIQINTSNDGTNFYPYGGALVAGVTSSATYAWGSLIFPDGVQYIQLVGSSNTGQNVTLSADISYVANIQVIA